MKKIVQPKEPIITIFPYPVSLVSCKYKGNSTITPIAWISPVCNDPPLFGISLRPERYIYNLIKNSKKFGINFPTKEILEEVDYCGTFSGKDVNKLEETDLTFFYTNKNSPPLIKECPINLECELKHATDLGSHTHFIGELKKILFDESIVDNRGISRLPDFFVGIDTNYYEIGKQIGKCQEVYKRKFSRR